MAGDAHGHAPVKFDPSVESWASMRENVYKTFKFTRNTTKLSIIFALAVPVVTYSILQGQDLKWDWQGKKRDESLYLKKPSTP